MWYIIAITISGLGLILGIMSCFSGAPAKADPGNEEPDQKDDTIKKHLSRAELIAAMQALAEKKVPDKLSEGAMCYKVAMPPDRYEYVCPSCGHKTLYTDDLGYYLNRNLHQCRALVKNLTAVDARLDESSFCKKCSPDNKEKPSLCLITRCSDDENTYQSCQITDEDLVLLNEFFAGKVTHRDNTDYETPLKDELKRIASLLGITYPEK